MVKQLQVECHLSNDLKNLSAKSYLQIDLTLKHFLSNLNLNKINSHKKYLFKNYLTFKVGDDKCY